MKNHARIALLFSVAAMLFAGMSTGMAAAAPCPSGTPNALTISAPTTVAFGRTFYAKVETGESGGWSAHEVVTPGLFTFESALAENASPDAFSEPIPNTPTGEYPTSPPLVIHRGEGPGIFTATWTQGMGGERYSKQRERVECEAATWVTTTPIVGTPSVAEPEYAESKGNTLFRLSLSCPAPGFDKSQVSTSPVIVVIRSEAKARRTVVPDVCEGRIPPTRSRHWTLTQTETKSGQALMLRPKHVNNRPTLIHFTAWQAGRKLASGHFEVVAYSHGGGVIHEGSDAFVNYCIDAGRKIMSLNGRLYCTYPGSYSTFVLHAKWSGGSS